MIGLIRSTNKFPAMMLRRLANVRSLSQTNRVLEKSSDSSVTPSSAPSQPPPSESPSSGQPWKKSGGYAPTNFDKRILVWSGKFKSVSDVPETIAIETLNRARDQCRVKGCLWMMLACVVGCIIQIYRGKQAAERGESVSQSNIDWHKQYNENAKNASK